MPGQVDFPRRIGPKPIILEGFFDLTSRILAREAKRAQTIKRLSQPKNRPNHPSSESFGQVSPMTYDFSLVICCSRGQVLMEKQPDQALLSQHYTLVYMQEDHYPYYLLNLGLDMRILRPEARLRFV